MLYAMALGTGLREHELIAPSRSGMCFATVALEGACCSRSSKAHSEPPLQRSLLDGNRTKTTWLQILVGRPPCLRAQSSTRWLS